MTKKDWDDIPYVTGDCIRDTDEWNDMIDYVRHSSCTDFTIYSTCPSTGQAFRFTQDGTDSQMFGGGDSGDDLHIWGNDNAAAVNIAFMNTGEFKIFDGATEGFNFKMVGINSYLEGSSDAGDKLRLKGTSVDILPQIVLQGGFHIEYNAQANKKHMFQMGSTTFIELYETGTNDVIEGKTAGNDLYLKPVGLLKWGTEQTNAGNDRGELVPFKTAAGTTVYLKTYDLV